MRPRWPLLLLEVVALSVPLTWLWLGWGEAAYAGLLERLASPLLAPLGVEAIADSPARKRFVSFVPFLVLMLATPGLGARRRLAGLALGVPAICAVHVGLVAVEHLAATGRRPTQDVFSTVFPAAMFADAFPFMLWALIAQRELRAAFRRLRGREQQSST